MKILGWLVAYWGVWVTLGSFVLMVRFQPWCEEWQLLRDATLIEKLQGAWDFLVHVTFWPREYRDQEFMELFSDDDDQDTYDDDEDEK